jgi:hypothetical protein
MDPNRTLELLTYAAEDGDAEHAAALLDALNQWHARGGFGAEVDATLLVRWNDEPHAEPHEVRIVVTMDGADQPDRADDGSISYYASAAELVKAATTRRLGDWIIAEMAEVEE